MYSYLFSFVTIIQASARELLWLYLILDFTKWGVKKKKFKKPCQKK